MLAVVVLTKNSERTLRSCLAGLLESTIKPDEIIIVDGGSTDGTLKIVEDFKSKARIKTVFDGGRGLGYAREIGWRSTRDGVKYVAMVDSDVIVDKTFFQETVKILEDDSKMGALGAKLKPQCDEKGILALFQVKNLAIHLHWNEKPYPSEVVATHTACTVFRKSALQEVNGFDPYFNIAKEDSDIGFRLRRAGYRLSYLDHFANHLETGRRFWKINFRYGRSYVLLAKKHPVEGRLWTKKNILLSLSLIIFPLELIVWLNYLLKYLGLKDLSRVEALKLSFVETVRQAVRTAGMLYELVSG
ncbi:MAG: glycosyltransferase family 2 protein [Thermoproteota archaeon]